jgi:LemA protein
MLSLFILGVISILVWYSIMVFNQLMKLKCQLQWAFTAVDATLQHRYQQIQIWLENSKADLVDQRDTIDALLQLRMTAAGQLKVAAYNPSDCAAMQQLAITESTLQSALETFSCALSTSARLALTPLWHELKKVEQQLSLARHSFNHSVHRYNSYKQSFPALLLSDFFGHQDNACLLEWVHRASLDSQFRQGGR